MRRSHPGTELGKNIPGRGQSEFKGHKVGASVGSRNIKKATGAGVS